MIGCCEGEVRDCCLKSYWVIYFSNVLLDHIPGGCVTAHGYQHANSKPVCVYSNAIRCADHFRQTFTCVEYYSLIYQYW